MVAKRGRRQERNYRGLKNGPKAGAGTFLGQQSSGTFPETNLSISTVSRSFIAFLRRGFLLRRNQTRSSRHSLEFARNIVLAESLFIHLQELQLNKALERLESGNKFLVYTEFCTARKHFFQHAQHLRWENPLIRWTSTGDPLSYTGETGLSFDSVDATNAFAEKHGWEYITCGIRKGFGLALHASKIVMKKEYQNMDST
ncbi:hypothetical protein RDI58_011753 [Solanum bulbocastanum]|uniref:NADH dehydrogenase [ubiquinone] iron-sulfur protein 4, mitochondrial n=1 Tax=Solanum bulbocastanum TaxID=147425 RepID=A0AAN8YHM1_SOLBU